MYLIDTNVAIFLRDVDLAIADRVDALTVRPQISLPSWVKLEGGVYIDPGNADARRINLDSLPELLEVLPVDAAVVRACGVIVAACGFSRPRVVDRLIAATAIVDDLALITVNASDFRAIPDLKPEIWRTPKPPPPAQ